MSENLEFNILGCNVRISSNEKDNKKALKAIEMLKEEIKGFENSTNLQSIDIAVLSALKLASKNLDLEAEYKENVLALRSDIKDALEYVEDVSSAESNIE